MTQHCTHAVCLSKRIEEIAELLAGGEPLQVAPPPAPRRLHPAARHFTLIDYLTENHPGHLEWLTCDPAEAFEEDELWMNFREAQMGLAPMFASNGARLWHPALLGWAVLRMRVGGES